MQTIEVVLLGIGLLAIGFFIGVAFSIEYSTHLIKSGKRVPRFLRDINITMPDEYKKG